MSDQTAKAEIKVRQVKNGVQVYIDLPTKKGSQPSVLNQSKLSTGLAQLLRTAPKSLEGVAVEYLAAGGQVQRVWEAGKEWDRSAETQPAPARSDRQGGRPPGRSGPGGGYGRRRPDQGGGGGYDREPDSRSTGDSGRFENPYNFIPALGRDRDHPDLGDAEPLGHHRYHPGCWSGRIRVELTTQTPLLVPDLGIEQRDGHKVFGLRLDEKGNPFLPPTGIKGPLRSAYESITNSRMGVFVDHDEPLALRHPAQSGAGVIPVRVSDDGERLEILNGTTPLTADAAPVRGEPQCAAWLPRYATRDLLRRSENLAAHGARVWARIQQWKHYRKRKNRRPQQDEWNPDFRFWRVLELGADGAQAPPNSPGVEPHGPRQEPRRPRDRTYSTPIDNRTRWVRGWVMANGLNITRKHDERVFFDDSNGASPETLPLTAEARAAWGTLIASYREANDRELRRGHRAPSALPQNGDYEFSRHIRESSARSSENRLEPGTLCYAALEGNRGNRRVLALYPVMISRDLYPNAPASLLPKHGGPATAIDRLSPADRVFGWVNQKGNGSFKGQLRVGAATCEDGPGAIQRFEGEQGKALAILGQPKPAQARFYGAKDARGAPLDPGADKKTAYRPGGGLRGRKVYPHQAQAELPDYWTPVANVSEPLADRLNGRRVYREWLSHGQTRTDQNRSITAWIRPDTRFGFDLDLINLTDVELGALLWLLEELQSGYLRIGGGKPLGFGSASLKATRLDLRDGDALAADYTAFGKVGSGGRRIGDASQAATVIAAFKTALVGAMAQPTADFNDLTIVKAFRHAAKAGRLPTHYPRTDTQHGPVGDSYKWFVKNESWDKRRHERHSLPALYEDDDRRGLPELEEEPDR